MKKILRLIFNKYTIATGVFLAWVLVLDQNDWPSQRAREKELAKVKANIKFVQDETKQMEAGYAKLMTDPKELERYAREQYHMKKQNEDLYVIEKK